MIIPYNVITNADARVRVRININKHMHIAWITLRWIKGESCIEIAKSLGLTSPNKVNDRISRFVRKVSPPHERFALGIPNARSVASTVLLEFYKRVRTEPDIANGVL